MPTKSRFVIPSPTSKHQIKIAFTPLDPEFIVTASQVKVEFRATVLFTGGYVDSVHTSQ